MQTPQFVPPNSGGEDDQTGLPNIDPTKKPSIALYSQRVWLLNRSKANDANKPFKAGKVEKKIKGQTSFFDPREKHSPIRLNSSVDTESV